jgi:hypothetical protein
MSIYRGAGGAGDAIADSASEALLIRELAVEVQADADAAAASASAAASSASNASTSASNASTSATNAASSASAASTSASNASSSASSASTSASNASTSATAAQTAETNAETAETNAVASAQLAQDWATKTTGPVAGGEYSSKYNAQQSATSASAASSSASAASTSATNASNSASAAATSATNAASSATSASGSASTATTQASNASTSASNAASSATSASGSATTATTQAGLASTSASNAASSASAASTSASNAATSATNASNSASSASTSATNASNSASSAATSATNAAASYDSFDDRYLGAKSSAPTLDNDGNTLLTGALYFNTSSNLMKVWSGSSWLDAYASLSGALTASNNLSDLTSVSTARTNLGLGTAATTASTDYATAAQGTKADSALQPATIGSTVQGYDADLQAIGALTGTSGLLKKTAANTWSLDTSTYLTTAVTSVTGTSPVASSGGTTPAISLSSGYGDTQNPYASKTANYVLASPNGSAGVPTFRAIVAADIPTLNQNTTGSAGSVTNSHTAGTGLTGTTFNGSAAVTWNATGTTINSQTSAYTLVAADAGKSISITTGGVTIPNAVMSAGNIVTIYNNSGSSQTITQGASLTLQWAGQSSSTTGNRTLGLYGIATIIFISSSVAVISGAGLT